MPDQFPGKSAGRRLRTACITSIAARGSRRHAASLRQLRHSSDLFGLRRHLLSPLHVRPPLFPLCIDPSEPPRGVAANRPKEQDSALADGRQHDAYTHHHYCTLRVGRSSAQTLHSRRSAFESSSSIIAVRSSLLPPRCPPPVSLARPLLILVSSERFPPPLLALDGPASTPNWLSTGIPWAVGFLCTPETKANLDSTLRRDYSLSPQRRE